MAFKNRFYPHLLPYDIPVWERYLASHGDQYIKIEYDVRVGEGSRPPRDLPDNIRQMWVDLSKKRIDAVAWRLDKIVLIEITRRAGMKAIGQLRTYPILYNLTYKPFLPAEPLLVAEQLLPDIKPALAENNIPYILLPGPKKTDESFPLY